MDDSDSEEVINNNEEKKFSEPSITVVSLANLCEDSDVNNDAKFCDDFQLLLDNQNSSKLFTPYISQLKAVNKKARRSVKKRIELHRTRKIEEEIPNNDTHQGIAMEDEVEEDGEGEKGK